MLHRILQAMSSQAWAITAPAMDALIGIVNRVDLDLESQSQLHTLSSEDRLSMQVNLGEPVDNTYYTSVIGDVGVISIYGPLIPRATFFSRASGSASYDQLTKEFKSLDSDPRISKIALVLDTPGGAVTGLSDFVDVVANSTKETVAFAWMAASAGYWIASAADSIVAPDTGIVGSIGAVVTMVDTTDRDAKQGIKRYDIVSSQSPLKRAAPNTDTGQAMYQTIVDDLADVFVRTVANNRRVTVDTVLSDYGQGAIVVAADALHRGMIDKIESLDKFVAGLVTPITYGATRYTAEVTMSDIKTDETLTVAQLRERYPDAIAEVEKTAVDTEHNRLRSVEALADEYKSYHPGVVSAVRSCIDNLKYGACDGIHAEIFSAANKALRAEMGNLSDSMTIAADAANHTAKAAPVNALKNSTDFDDSDTITRLVAADKSLRGHNG